MAHCDAVWGGRQPPHLIEHGWLQEVDANLRRNDPLWREIGEGHGTTLVVTDAGLLAIGIEPVVVKAVVAIREHAAEATAPTKVSAASPKQRSGTKQAMLIEMLRRPEGGTIEEIMATTGWLAHTAWGALSGTLGKKLGLIVTSAKEDDRGRVYRIVEAK
jgi:hypothetical protein